MSAHHVKMASGEDGARQRRAQNDNKNGSTSASGGFGVNTSNPWAQWPGFPGFSTLDSPSGSQPNQANGSSSPSPESPRPTYHSAHEYAVAVQQWIWQCQMWNSMNWFYMTSFPMHMMNMMSRQQWQQQLFTGDASNVNGTTTPLINPAAAATMDANGNANRMDLHQAGGQAVPQGAGDLNNNPDIGIRYRIPSLWKRVAAEFIDFFVLFVIKLAVTILTVEYVGIVDIQKYDLDLLLSQNIDYNTAFAMTSELIAMEIINRIFICIFETLCLRRGVGGQIGGTTPGKSLMGLRVVLCEQIFDGPGRQIVRVIPASDIGLWNALMRSVIKNFSLAFFFPVCFTVFFFQHNRAAYDIISNCIVVETAT